MTSEARLVGLLAFALFGIAWIAVGSGPINGDAAVYAHQATNLDFSQRWTHLGWVLLLSVSHLGPIPAGVVADLWVVASAVGCVVVAARLAREREDGAVVMAATVAGLVVLPVASWGEVDLVWVVLVALSAMVSSSIGSASAMAAAVSVSPTALLALPWLVFRRDTNTAPLWGAGLAVFAISAWSAGAWWTGDRGVLMAGSSEPFAALRRWAPLLVLPWVASWPRGGQSLRALLLLPLLLAPVDTASWAMMGVAAAAAATGVGGRNKYTRIGALAIFALVALHGWSTRWDRVVRDREFVGEVAKSLGDATALIAPWTMGVRISIAVTGDPYDMLWRIPIGWVRFQRESWCADRDFTNVLRVTSIDDRWQFTSEPLDPARHMRDCSKSSPPGTSGDMEIRIERNAR